MRFLSFTLLLAFSFQAFSSEQEQMTVCKYYLNGAYVRGEINPTSNSMNWGSGMGDRILDVNVSRWSFDARPGHVNIKFSERHKYRSCKDENGNNQACVKFTTIRSEVLDESGDYETSIESDMTINGVPHTASITCRKLIL